MRTLKQLKKEVDELVDEFGDDFPVKGFIGFCSEFDEDGKNIIPVSAFLSSYEEIFEGEEDA